MHNPFLSSPQKPLLLISSSTFSLIKEKIIISIFLHNKPLFSNTHSKHWFSSTHWYTFFTFAQQTSPSPKQSPLLSDWQVPATPSLISSLNSGGGLN